MEFFTVAKPRTTESLQDSDAKLLHLISQRPYDLEEAGKALGVQPYAFNVSRLERLGLLTRIGVTPTDILHAEGTYSQYDAEASSMAVEFLARKTNLSKEEFIAKLKDMITLKIARSIVGNLILDDSGQDRVDELTEELIYKAISKRHGQDFGISIKIDKPLIGIGAPVGSWLPRVAEIFDTELLLPEDSDVGNAVGAISGSVFKEVSLLIQPEEGAYSSNPPSIVLLDQNRIKFNSLNEAIEFAKEKSGEIASKEVGRSGVSKIIVDFDVLKKTYGTADAGNVVLETKVVARATGKPDLASG